MSEQDLQGYGYGDVTSIMSVDDVQREAERIAEHAPTIGALEALVKGDSFLIIDDMRVRLRADGNPARFLAARRQGPVALPDRAERCRQVDGAAFDLRLRHGDERQHPGERQGNLQAVVQRQAQGRRHRLYPAGQFRVPRHDGGGKPLDGRLPQAQIGGSARGGRQDLRQIRPPRPAAASAGARAVGRRAAAAWKSRARW